MLLQGACRRVRSVDAFLAARVVGCMGVVSAALVALRLSLELAPPGPNGDGPRLAGELANAGGGYWSRGPRPRFDSADPTPDIDIIITYFFFVLWSAFSSILLILASYVVSLCPQQRRWSLEAWLLAEAVSVVWQLRYPGPQHGRYAPGASDFMTTLLDIVTGFYLWWRAQR